jgi:type IV secretory pathway ATPase VirB11/archaellum biosynthesis ATPase
MTAVSGGERLDDGPSPVNPVLEQADAIAGDAHRGMRSPGDIFPLRDDPTRARQMQESWLSFGGEMAEAVRSALDASRSPPEIAYALGEIVHNYFRTRGVILTSYELRRLVAELLAVQRPPAPLVAFTSAPAPGGTAWTGDEPGTPGPVVPDVAFEAPPSPLVDRTLRDSPGPLDRLWADRSVDSVFVHGPTTLYVERKGVLEASAEQFRDRAHLRDLVRRLAPDAASPVVPFRLRDGGEGLVIFPPAAPDGPVLVLRRGAPGEATFERLIASAILDRPMADLLRLAARSRLNVLVVGPAGSGKTALLAALARDLGDEARIVTVARDRAFRWRSASKVELVVPEGPAFATLLAAAAQLGPHLLILDAVRAVDVPAVAELLSRGGRGIVAALEPPSTAGLPRRSVDLVVRLDRVRDGLCGVVAMEDENGAPIFAHRAGGLGRGTTAPSFAGLVNKAGYGETLARVLGR